MTPDLEAGVLRLRVFTRGRGEGLKVEASALEDAVAFFVRFVRPQGVLRDGRADLDIDDVDIDLKFQQRILDQNHVGIDFVFAGGNRFEIFQQFDGRQILLASGDLARLLQVLDFKVAFYTPVGAFDKLGIGLLLARF